MGLTKRTAIGVVTHADTLARGANDSHPIGSITNLQPTLDSINSNLSAAISNEINGGDFGDGIVGETIDGGDF